MVKINYASVFLSRATLILVSSALAVLCVACSEDKRNTVTGGNEQPAPIGDLASVKPAVESPTPAVTPEVQSLEPSESEPSLFEQGLDKAVGAWVSAVLLNLQVIGFWWRISTRMRSR